MRLLKPLAVFVLAILTTQVGVNAQQPNNTSIPPEVPGEYGVHVGDACAPGDGYGSDPNYNGFDQYRRSPDLGGHNSAGFGFKHFALPFQNYTLWHRPKAATLTKYQRCYPEKFRPRGFGNLFARPCDSFRMDYSPHVLRDRDSEYGPSYLLRNPDHRCENCK